MASVPLAGCHDQNQPASCSARSFPTYTASKTRRTRRQSGNCGFVEGLLCVLEVPQWVCSVCQSCLRTAEPCFCLVAQAEYFNATGSCVGPLTKGVDHF